MSRKRQEKEISKDYPHAFETCCYRRNAQYREKTANDDVIRKAQEVRTFRGNFNYRRNM